MEASGQRDNEDRTHGQSSIATVDADGVAFAVIQGLHQKLEIELQRQAAENSELPKQNRLLQQRLERLELLVQPD
jgi:hypothetical protein